jgi:uncharacterized protein YbjT (DUF2867 family)
MLLLTGATGLVGSAVRRRLTAAGQPVRCLVRDPRRLGPDRVRVQIALGDLADPHSFRHALRGVKTVVHLAASERDQPHATIEELDALATWRLVRAAERARVEHFVFATPLGATDHHPSRVHRAKAMAERAVEEAGISTTILATSLVYAPGDRRMSLATRLSYLPAMPVPAMGGARSQPIWADDVAACIAAVIADPVEGSRRLELAGPDTFTHRQVVALALRAVGHRRRLIPLPDVLLRPALRAYEAAAGPTAFATWDESQLLAASMVTPRGTRDAERLGVRPQPMPAVLGLA